MTIESLATLSLASPLWAWGVVAAVGLPVLAHLLSRSRYREAWFPATRLVKQAVVATARVERPRHLLLLLIRLLALLLIVAAFMRPRWVPQAEADDPDTGVSLVVLLDTSASMRRTDSGATLHQRAVAEADSLISQLDPRRDVASVVLVGRLSNTLMPEPTARLNQLRQLLQEAEPGFTSADWVGALATTERLLASGTRTPRIVVISDQQGDWPREWYRGSNLRQVELSQTRIDGPSDNIAIRLSDIRPFPPVAGQATTVQAELTNYGDRPREVTVRTRLGDSTASKLTELTPGSTNRVELSLIAPKQGLSPLYLWMDGIDALNEDNRSGGMLEIEDRTEILIAYADPSQRALAERLRLVVQPGEDAGLILPKVKLLTITEAIPRLKDTSATQPHAMILLSKDRLEDQVRIAFEQFTKRGGGVIQIEAATPPVSTSPVNASEVDFSIEPLRVFEGPARTGITAMLWPLVQNENSRVQGSQMILKTMDARPIISYTQNGRGRWVHMHAALRDRPGGLLAEPTFVVLFNELWRFASPGPLIAPPLRPGDSFPEALTNNDQISFPEQADETANRITAPGHYLQIDSSGDLIAGAFAELNPDESDTSISSGWQDPQTSIPSSTSTKQRSTALLSREPAIELWPYLLLATVLLMSAESSLLWRFNRTSGDSA